ncbi:MAG: metalloregulator ArsR/SmtB family transcription factor [Pseudomonadota bacterium]|jgi:DNA-binding transcriptional ArsR family regulator|nr:metalloregulator ArsR/SmtB family transcription factor [Pseudomonadota bacterium]HON39425.1 metalloregulator ArsR/SmtB family transcription factor [Deltaproteobacteria bacterium]HPD22540.1 metalloregulator ArsR/SmtB family transcription factor [Deltaproteobacteria bacterium]HRS57501.1 metalloregulator ArsR/SmtB family transcription factor [Desulfomonilia bacterium]HRV36803.1 metalloregulator ArsR/SmtB family transcription factor [Desulfomonilia bacterium]
MNNEGDETVTDREKAQYEAKARVLKALAHPTRLWMVERLAEREHCVCEFFEAVDADFSTVSKHLSVLRQAGIVDVEKRGKQMFYRLRVPCVLQFMGCIEAVLLDNAAAQCRAAGLTPSGISSSSRG